MEVLYVEDDKTMKVISMNLPVHDGTKQNFMVKVETLTELVQEIKTILTLTYQYRLEELATHSRTYCALLSMHHDMDVKGAFPEDEELVRVAKEAIKEYGPQIASKADVDAAIESFDSINF